LWSWKNEPATVKKENRCTQKSNKSIHDFILDIYICDSSLHVIGVETKEITLMKIIFGFYIFFLS
jgi:hypothetical protein